MHHDWIDSDQVEQHDLLRETLAQFRSQHRMAAVLDHKSLAAKAPDIRQRFDEHFGPLMNGVLHWGA